MIFQMIEVGILEGYPGWHVNTTLEIDGWEQWKVAYTAGRPTFASGNTVCYTFAAQMNYYQAVDAANNVGALLPPFKLPVPTQVTMRQARLALFELGHSSAIDTAISALSEPTKTIATIEYTFGAVVYRYNGFVAQIGAAIGLTEAQIDQIFVLADTK